MSIFIIIIVFAATILLSSCSDQAKNDIEKTEDESSNDLQEESPNMESDESTILKIGSLELDLEEPFETSISKEDGEEIVQLTFSEETTIHICYEPSIKDAERIRMVDAHNKPNLMFGILKDEGWEDIDQSINPKEIKINGKDVWQAQFKGKLKNQNRIAEIYQFLNEETPVTIYFDTIEEEFEKYSSIIIKLI